MTSTERVLEYTDLPPEAPLETDLKPTEDWPDKGCISMDNMSLRYSEDGKDVLRQISCNIKANEKVCWSCGQFISTNKKQMNRYNTYQISFGFLNGFRLVVTMQKNKS